MFKPIFYPSKTNLLRQCPACPIHFARLEGEEQEGEQEEEQRKKKEGKTKKQEKVQLLHLGDVAVPDPPVLVEQPLQVVNRRPGEKNLSRTSRHIYVWI